MMKVKELIELLGRLNPENNITLAIAVKGADGDGYQKYACCEHFVVHECDLGEDELLGIDIDLWENESYRNIFCKTHDYPDSKFSTEQRY